MSLPFTFYIPSVPALAEQTVLSYISSSLYNGGMYNNVSGSSVTGSLIDPATNYNTGIANQDVQGPVVLVTCDSAMEVYYQTRVYRCNVDVSTRMMAYDSTTSSNYTNSAISFGGNVASLFGSSDLAIPGINTLKTGFAVIGLQVNDFRNERIEDAWISNTNLSITAALVSH